MLIKGDDVYKTVCKLQSTIPRALPFCGGEREGPDEMMPWRKRSLDQNGRRSGKVNRVLEIMPN